MNSERFREELLKLFGECLDIVKGKNISYATNEDPFKNFRLAEIMGICSTEDAILVRLCDKFSRIYNLRGVEICPDNEAFEDAVKDAINYLGIFLIYVKNKRYKH